MPKVTRNKRTGRFQRSSNSFRSRNNFRNRRNFRRGPRRTSLSVLARNSLRTRALYDRLLKHAIQSGESSAQLARLWGFPSPSRVSDGLRDDSGGVGDKSDGLDAVRSGELVSGSGSIGDTGARHGSDFGRASPGQQLE